MTPAETLMAAATLLRKRLEHATKGPWWGDDLDEVQSPAGQIARTLGTGGDGVYPYPNSRYMALMHPGVGAALVRLLEQAADALTGCDVADDEPALAAARAILGQTDRNQT
ncbi:hypothetical protein ACWENO_13955 [Streptomyces sp. NPDC004436]